MKKVFRRRFSFSNDEKYRIFLKQQIFNLNPQYYVVADSKPLDTTDGPMLCLKLSTDISNPDFPPIVEAKINNQLVYLLDNQCWTVAVNQHDSLMILDEVNTSTGVGHKIIIVHQIGQDLV
jgi:hypothetical protein